jgi:hypothetical protein
VPAPSTRTIGELCADGVRGEVYAHELFSLPSGGAPAFLAHVLDTAVALYGTFGWILAGAWTTAMCNESECILLWAIPTWEQWASFEKASLVDGPLRTWSHALSLSGRRFLAVDAPLSPFRTGRQPAVSDRVDDWNA